MPKNSFAHFFQEEPSQQIQEKVNEREAALVRKIEAVQRIRQSADWSSLKTEEFDNLTARLEREMLAEAKNEHPDTNKLNRLAGEMKWSSRFSNLEVWEKEMRGELQAIRQRKHGNND